MNRYSPTRETEASLVLPFLLQFSNGDLQTIELLSDLEHNFKLEQFQLGELAFSLPNPLEKTVPNEQNNESFYLICQGRIRLLSFDPEKQRDVPTQLLCEGETFGGDALFTQTSLPYKAIAATDSTCVARISTQQLQSHLERLSELKDNWCDEAKKRQALIFLKTISEWRSHSSHRLQNLVPYLNEKKIAAGESLARVTPSDAGHFWLINGRIDNPTLVPGKAWGYPDATPENGTSTNRFMGLLFISPGLGNRDRLSRRKTYCSIF
ncbi:MAG: cyclic nucleotide-binding domain-containing protein, partial [Hydrococcus sp. RU_2_2]|nr:cyclic nucleotide-binding domain-containing protein [Hydrococcus sp. RU_2_2]